MLHLFNSCYVYPDFLFEPVNYYAVVGRDNKVIGSSLEKSFYHSNTITADAVGRFETVESFISSSVFDMAINNKEKFIVYCDEDSYIQFYTRFLKTQISNLNPGLFLQLCRLQYRRLKTRAKLIQNEVVRTKLEKLAFRFLTISNMPEYDRFDLSESWVRNNCGIEWKLIVGKSDGVEDIVNRCVYSFLDEAKAKFLSRKELKGSWVEDHTINQYSTVKSFPELYNNIRKEIALFTDNLILTFYKNKNSSGLLNDPKFLLLLSSNKNMADKVDIWGLRWFMTMPKQTLNQLGILA